MSGQRTTLVRTVAALGSMTIGTALLLGTLPGSASAEEVPPQVPSSSVVSGDNPTCASLGDYDFEYKIDEEDPEGQFTDPVTGIVVEVTIVDDDPVMVIDFTTSIAVSAVFVKSGNGGILYTYDPPTMSDEGLASPNDSISHISFCWDEEDSTSSSESTSSSTSDSSTSSSMVEESTTTLGEESTTTLGEESTTSVGEEATTTTESAEGQLPRTGSTTFPLVAIGALLVAGGFGLLLATRLRKS